MLKPSDYNSAVPQFTNGNYASNPITPLYVEEPGATEYNRGAEPLQTLPAQWWNWFLNQFTSRFNKLNIYVKNIFNELTQLLSLVSITPDGTESTPTTGQLKQMFQTEYPKYLALLMYPIGSIYWTSLAPDNGGNPNTLFGGTWVQIKDKFVLAAGDVYTAGATGGASTVTLTVNNLPSHTHPIGGSTGNTQPTFTGTEVTSGAGTAHAHGLNSHTHNMEHKHGYTPAGKISSTSGGSDNKTAGMSGNATGSAKWVMVKGDETISYTGNLSTSTTKDDYWAINPGTTTWQIKFITMNVGIAHTHNAYFKGTASSTTSMTNSSGTAITNTGAASGNTANESAHTHKVTASGTVQNHSHTLPANTGTNGSGTAVDIMPPYVVKYCWERTA
jgi:hypothetical protein